MEKWTVKFYILLAFLFTCSCLIYFFKYISLLEWVCSILLILIIAVFIIVHNAISWYKKKFYNYNKFIAIYEAILTASNDCWMTLGKMGNIIGFSEKLPLLLGVKSLNTDNFLESFKEEDSLNIENHLQQLITKGKNFNIVCNTTYSSRILNIYGIRFIIKGVITNSVWLKDITSDNDEKQVICDELRKNINEKSTLEILVDSIEIPLWVRNKDLKLEFCNKNYSNIVEKSKEEIIRNNIPLVKGTTFGGGDSLARNASKTEKQQKILQNIVISGKRKKYEIGEIPLANGQIIGFGLDKTEEYNAIRELDRYMKAHGDVLEMLSTAIAIFNADTKLIFFNAAYQKLTSIDEGWLHAEPKFTEILDEMRRRRKLPEVVDFSKYKKERLDMFLSLCSSTLEVEYLPDGRTLRVISSPYPLGGIILMYEDVSDNLDLQRQHNTLLEVQKETIDNLYEGVAVYASDNKIKLFNPAFKKIWNIDENVVLSGVHIAEVMEYMKEYMSYGDDWSRYKDSAISNLTDRIPKTGRIFRKNDTVVNFSYLPLPDGSHVHSYIDVTSSWMVEKALYEKNKAMEEAEHIKSEFITNISTELRSSLNKIIDVSQTINSETPGILEIMKYANELCTLISDLTDLASIEAGTIDMSNSNVNLYKLLSNISEIFIRRFYQKNIKLNFEIDKSTNIIGDEKRLRQVVLNILNIGFKNELTNELSISVTKSNGYVKIIINNISIDKNNKNKLFPMIKGIIELHGGKIISKGNDFSFIIPISPLKNIENSIV